ncbi:hypothetical protein D3C74_494950 [compost metagenome]
MRDGDAVADGSAAHALTFAQAEEQAVSPRFTTGEQSRSGEQGGVTVGGRKYLGTHGRNKVGQRHGCCR